MCESPSGFSVIVILTGYISSSDISSSLSDSSLGVILCVTFQEQLLLAMVAPLQKYLHQDSQVSAD